ncbi:putative DEAD/DEAH box helicase [Colletotrichum sublineola]|uniref:Putative DEAD/DEAH box helicase n=1 Tax=Colletotrichum sublineola TaxID=1173701 RepID=A0A066XHA9_COLSU|nr:putative DEAD/DEAH box helicase [Colletotrichum sublineola]
MIVHNARYSDLRNFLYQPPGEQEFVGLKPMKRFSIPGLDAETSDNACFAFMHPIGSIVNITKASLDDASLEPRDCVQLWKTMISHETYTYKVKKKLAPEFDLPALLKKSDAIKWGSALKEQLWEWTMDPQSPFLNVYNDLKPQTTNRNRMRAPNGSTQLTEVSDVISLVSLSLLVDLRSRGAFLIQASRTVAEGRREVSKYKRQDQKWLAETVHQSPSIVFLPELPPQAAKILKTHNKKTLDIFETYVHTFVKQHLQHTSDDKLPFTNTRVSPTKAKSIDAYATNIPLLPPTIIRSSFTTLSGFTDNFTTIHKLYDTNAYIYDFFKHGDLDALVRDNKVKRGDNFLSSENFNDADMADVQDVGDVLKENVNVHLKQQKARASGLASKTLGPQQNVNSEITQRESISLWMLYKDITYLNNLGAAYFEKGDYDKAIEACTKAVEEGREIYADFKLIAKSYARIDTPPTRNRATSSWPSRTTRSP